MQKTTKAHRIPKHKAPPPILPELATLAVMHLGDQFVELNPRGSDSLDFHEVHVGAVRDLIEAAFAHGRASARLSAEIATINATPVGTIENGKHVPAKAWTRERDQALRELVELLEEGTTTDGVITIAPAGRVKKLIKAVRS